MVQVLYKSWFQISKTRWGTRTPVFKNHMKNLDNFKQAVKGPKNWDSMECVCPKITFLQLKHYIQRIYLTLLWTTCVKIYQIFYVIFEIRSRFSRHSFNIFLTQTLHTFDKSSPWKCKFSDFLLLALKRTNLSSVVF